MFQNVLKTNLYHHRDYTDDIPGTKKVLQELQLRKCNMIFVFRKEIYLKDINRGIVFKFK